MSTDKRDLVPNGIYHVYNRGNNKMTLFHDREDYKFFLYILKRFMIEFEFKLYAVCLMGNHIHLLIQDNGLNLPIIMDAIESMYACYYIDKYKYKGRVYESRFKSNRIFNSLIFLIVFRYINRNPVVARLVDSFLNYRWSIPTPDKDRMKLIDFKYVDNVFREKCKVGFLEYLNSTEDDLWIDPIEVQRMEDIDALAVYNKIADRMDVNVDNVMIPIINEKTSSFMNNCITHGITKKQIIRFSGISRYKIEKLLNYTRKI